MRYPERKQHDFKIVKWYEKDGKYTAIRVDVAGKFYNMALHKKYVQILNFHTARVWGSWVNMTICKALKSNESYQRKKAGLRPYNFRHTNIPAGKR